MLKSFRGATIKLWKRAFLLYSLSVVFTLTYTATVILLGDRVGLPPLWPRGENSFLLNTLLARYSYGWTDFLPRYAVFMALAPFVLWLITRGKSWIMAAVSGAVWIAFHNSPALLPFSAWEVLFFPSMIVGYYLPQIETWAQTMPKQVRRASAATLVGVAGLSFAVSSLLQVFVPMLGREMPVVSAALAAWAPYFDKATLGAGRLLLGVIWFWALYFVVRRYEQPIQRATLGILETFGAKSLYTYGIHGFVVFMFTIVSPAPSSVTVVDSTIVAIMVVALIYVLVVSPVVARYLSYQHYSRRLHVLLRYTRVYETT